MHASLRVAPALVLTALLAVGPASADTNFQFIFGDAASLPVGTGTLTAVTDPGSGTFPLSDLGPLNFTFTVSGQTFTQTSIVSDPAQTQVALVGGPSGQTLFFNSSSSVGTGPYGGSLDLKNPAGAILSFQPGNSQQAAYGFTPPGGTASNSIVGQYQALASPAVPEPSSFALLALGLLPVGLLARRRRRA